MRFVLSNLAKIGLNAHTYRLLVFKERSACLENNICAVSIGSQKLVLMQQRDEIMEPFLQPVKLSDWAFSFISLSL
jgi:hypothetical protein